MNQSRQDLNKQVRNLEEKLQQHKALIAQDKKLLENTNNQLIDSSKALEEHEARVSVLRQQLQRAERLRIVQKDLVNKLEIQVKKQITFLLTSIALLFCTIPVRS